MVGFFSGRVVFKRKELLKLLVASFIAGFIISFRDWGEGSVVDVSRGLEVLLFSSLIAVIIIFLRVAFQKFVAFKLGYEFDYDLSRFGLALSILITFLSYGFVPFISPFKLEIREVKRLRLGSFRGGLNYKDLAVISMAGSLFSVLLMLLVKPVFLFSNNFFVFKIIVLNAALSVSSLFPVPETEGFNIFYYRRWLGVFVLSFTAFYFFLIIFFGFFSYFVSLVLASITTYFYVKNFD